MRYLGILCVLLLISCEERFEFETDENVGSRISINGYINQGDDPYYVFISQTRSSGAPTPIVGATVLLKDQQNNITQFREIERGTYVSIDRNVRGTLGEAYFIEVSLISGELYRSQPDTIPSITANYDMKWREYLKVFTSELGGDFDLPVVSFDLNVELPQTDEPLYMNWLGEELYQFVPTDFPDPFGSIPPPCYVTQQFGTEQVHLFTNTGFDGNQTSIEEIFYREVDDSFVRKHIFSIYQYSISEQYYTYLRGVEGLVENTGSLFDTPPGQLTGNIKAIEGTDIDPVGFFSAYLSDTLRVAIYPTELETFIYEECLYRGGFNRDYDILCIDCLLIPRSTYQRPDFWVKY